MTSTRVPLISGNWKMNTTLTEARELSEALVLSLDHIRSIETVLCPPAISLTAVKEAISGSNLKLGAQNVHYEEKGAFTGELSPVMLAGVCDYVIIGHSERRHLFGEDDEFVNKKVKSVAAAGLSPILCVGETLDEREAGVTDEVLARQVTRGLDGLAGPGGLVVAYEPVWAIGTGKAASADDANTAISLIRRTVSQVMGQKVGQETRILYGGSVNQANIRELISQAEIDGALVGGASLKANDFTDIVVGASEAKGL